MSRSRLVFLLVIIMIKTIVSRKGGHFSKIVSVGVFPGQNDDELQVRLGNRAKVIFNLYISSTY